LRTFLGVPGLLAVRVQQAVVGVLVVDGQQAAARAVERVELQPVVVHAHLHGLLGGAVAGVGLKAGMAPGDAHRLAPGRQRRGDIALGHGRRGRRPRPVPA
jgi:hypothetical protein